MICSCLVPRLTRSMMQTPRRPRMGASRPPSPPTGRCLSKKGTSTGWGKKGRVGTAARISRARAGDDDAFRELPEPHRRELQVHCYRMLGSFQDAEDALQDTLLAA